MTSMTRSPTRRPLTSRPLDLIYVVFFLTHIPASLLIDFQGLVYPPSYIPNALKALLEWYVTMSGDLLMKGASEGSEELGWFLTFGYLEVLFQFPVFFMGARGLWQDKQSIYVLLTIYGASTATTTLPCITYFLHAADKITPAQLLMLLSSYVPFFLVPLVMAIDMGLRVNQLIQVNSRAKRE